MLDMTDTIVPKSDQMNADDLMSGPRTFTISEVYKTGSDDQPFAVLLAEFDKKRPFKPSKSMRRVMVTAWGPDGDAYVGKRLTLYRDPDVKFGAQEVGGIRISHMSGIAKPLKLALTVTKGKRANYAVQPLADEPAPQQGPTVDELISAAQNATTNDELTRIARTAVAALKGDDLDAVKAVVTARREELTVEPTLPDGAE